MKHSTIEGRELLNVDVFWDIAPYSAYVKGASEELSADFLP
jgi:hypothetical protein